jgi:hypothetical protein
MLRFTLLLLLVPAVAHGQGLTRRERGDLAIRARAILAKHCGECHKEANGAGRLDVLDHAKVIAGTVPVPFASPDGKRSQILEFLDAGIMPPGDRPPPSDDEIDVLRKWIGQKAPDYPRAFDDRTTLATMLKDFNALDEELRPHVRYLSLGHLVPADGATDTLGKAELRLRNSLLAATGQPVVTDPVDSTATLFRLDLRKVGWDAVDLFERVENKANKGVVPLVPFDLILLEYPDSVAVPADLAAKFAAFQKATGQRLPVPYLKADWFSQALAGAKVAPKATPLAEELKSLVALQTARAKKGKLPDGPAFTEEKVRFTGANVLAEVPPTGAIYSADVDPKPQPFQLNFEAVDARQKSIEAVFVNEPFMLKVGANRAGHFHLLQVWADGTVDSVEPNGGSLLAADKPRVFSPKADAKFLISSLITGLGDGYEHFVVLASETEAKPPVIVRSVHPERPIWRFLPDESVPAVRRVVTLHVTKK